MKSILKSTAPIVGRSATMQRRLLLDLLRKAEGHLDADQLYRKAREREPRISLATVYRNLKLFKERGMIRESGLGESHAHYEISGEAEHHHLICLRCGRVIEFDSPLVVRAKEKIGRDEGFDILSVHLQMEGYCPKCKQPGAAHGGVSPSQQ